MRPIDADALVYELTEMVRHSTGEYKYGIDAARRVVVEAPTVGGWISVKDRLPENNAVCLTYSPKGRMRVAQAFLPSSIPNSKYDPMECWWSIHGDRSRFVAVTHWMPLPEPPQEVSGDA